jgi:hypothetical protein
MRWFLAPDLDILGDPMAATVKVNLDALIKREDFEIDKKDDEEPSQPVFCLPELEAKKITFKTLRKPIFQRATSDWTPRQVVDLVKNFVDRELIPSIIIWNSRSRLQFVMDGAHRLSALIAWVNDDYGAGAISQAAAGGIDKIPKAQREAHSQAKELMVKEVGDYKDLVKVGESDETVGTVEQKKRSKGMTSLQVEVQNYGKPDPRKAEAAFYRINQGGTPLTTEEQEIIRTRRWPESIAARVLWRIENGRHYTLGFQPDKTKEIEPLAIATHELLLKPDKTDELPIIVPVMSGAETNAGIGLLDQFVHLANDLADRKIVKHNFEPLLETDPKIDRDGDQTIEYLKKSKRLAEVISSGEKWSLGMHPLVYAYSTACKFLPGAFFAQVKLVKHLLSHDRVIWFTKYRKEFENFLVSHKEHLTTLTHDAGSKIKSANPIFEYWKLILESIADGKDPILAIQKSDFKGVFEMPDQFGLSVSPRIKKGGKLAVKIRETLANCPVCYECGARIYRKAWTHDHDTPADKGGSGHSENLNPMHGICNSGVKQQRLHLTSKPQAKPS